VTGKKRIANYGRPFCGRARRTSSSDPSPITRHSSLVAILSCCCLAPPSVHALTIEHSSATYADKHYQYEMTALLDAPLDEVRTVLRDYEGYRQLDSRILEARVLERPEHYIAILETTLRVCMGPFCRNVKRIERVEESPLELTAVADAARSDVKFGETHMMLSTSEGRTRVSYRTNIVPGFWVPAVVGRRWLLNTLEDATTDLFRSIEAKAQQGLVISDQ
jgi:hypothetical protein